MQPFVLGLGLLAAAVVVKVVVGIWSALRVPAALQHIPRIPPWLLAKKLIVDKFDTVRLYNLAVSLFGFQPYHMRFALGKWYLFIQDPVAAKAVLLAAKVCDKYVPSKHMKNGLFLSFMDNNIVLTEYSDWVRHRRVISPALTGNKWDTRQFGEAVHDALLGGIVASNGQPLNAHELTTAITIAAFGDVLFDTKFNARGNRFSELYSEIIAELFNPVYVTFTWLDTPLNPFRRPVYNKVQELDKLFYELVAAKRQKLVATAADDTKADASRRADLLTLLIQATDAEAAASIDGKEPTLTIDELRNDVIVLYLAGHDTSATALAVALYYLARHPHIQDKARQSVIDVLGDDPAAPIPSFEEQKQLAYLTMIIKECLRLFPPIAHVPPRSLVDDFTLPDGTVLPRGTNVSVSNYAIHRNPQYWRHPDEFDPERFADEANDGFTSAKNPAWMPFGAGVRQCPGMSFAMVEMRVMLSILLRLYEIKLEMDADEPLKFTVAATQLSPTNIRVSFKSRV